MRPVFFGASLNPPVMDVLIPAESLGDGYRIVRGIRIRALVRTLEEARLCGAREVLAFTPEQIELLREIAVPATREELLAGETPAFSAEAIADDGGYSGPVFCPACCRRLGSGRSPALGYLSRCPGCERGLTVRRLNDGLSIELSP